MTLSAELPGSLHFPGVLVGRDQLIPLLSMPERVRIILRGDGIYAFLAARDVARTLTLNKPGNVSDELCWVASWINRACRLEHAAPRQPGTADNLTTNDVPHARQCGVLIVKPGVRLHRETLSSIKERLKEVGYDVTADRSISAAEIRNERLIRRHYAAHWSLAELGTLRCASN